MTDETAIKQIRSGDEKAIAMLINKYSRMLWKTAASVLGASESDIEECVADVFISLWQKPEQYDASRGKLSTWLCTMAKNKALDRLRSIKARREESSELLPEMGTDSEDTSSAYDIEQGLTLLSAEDQEILKRRYYHDQKPAEIAKDMGMDKKKVENRLFHSKKKLRKALTDQQSC